MRRGRLFLGLGAIAVIVVAGLLVSPDLRDAVGGGTADFAGTSRTLVAPSPLQLAGATQRVGAAPLPTFTIVQSELIVQVRPWGRVVSDPAGIDCQGPPPGSNPVTDPYTECRHTFLGVPVKLSAATDRPGGTVSWQGDCRGVTPTCDVSMSQGHTVSVSFTPALMLSVVVHRISPGGTAGVDGVDLRHTDGSPCGLGLVSQMPREECIGYLPVGTQSVTLHALPAQDQPFRGWGSAELSARSANACGTTTATTCVFPLRSDTLLSASAAGDRSADVHLNFGAPSALSVLTVKTTDQTPTGSRAGPGGVEVKTASGPIGCSSYPGQVDGCVWAYPPGTSVTLVVEGGGVRNTNGGALTVFDGFSGGCSGQSCTITMGGARTVTALYHRE